MTTALAQLTDYEMLIGPVDTADEPKVDYLLLVASSVVAQAAPGLLPWAQGTPPLEADGVTPAPVPEPAVLVTCQTTSSLVNDPMGKSGKLQMERVGTVAAQYAPNATDMDSLLPVAWRRLLKPWRAPDIAAIRLTVPHPMEWRNYYGGWGLSWLFPSVDVDANGDPIAPDPGYYDGWGENANEYPYDVLANVVEPPPYVG
jgi:hypothetical protein